jgi:hypothetical protein
VRQETGKEQAVEVDCDEGVAIRSSPEDQCDERPGFAENPTGKGRNLQGGISNVFGGVPEFGSWTIDQTSGKTGFCIADTAQCVDVTPQ